MELHDVDESTLMVGEPQSTGLRYTVLWIYNGMTFRDTLVSMDCLESDQLEDFLGKLVLLFPSN